jgi:hypothetical protein
MRFLLAGTLAASVLAAQNLPCPEKSVEAAVTVDARTGGNGSSVDDLRVADFQILGKGLTSPVMRVDRDAPLDLVILIEAFNRGSALSGAAPLLLSELRPEDRVAVFTYGTGVDKRTGWEQDHGIIGKAIEEGGKGIEIQAVRPLNAIVEGLKMFPDTVDPRRKRMILLIGDEQDWSTPVRIESLLATLQAKRVTLNVVMDPPRGKVMGKILPRVNITPGNIGEPRVGEQQGRYGAQSVAKLAQATGGDAVAPNGVWALEEMAIRMKERYQVGYCAEKKHASKMPVVTLTDEAKGKRAPLELNAPGAIR